MKGLMIKDFKLMSVQRQFFLLIIIIAFGMLLSAKDASMITFPLGFVMFVISLFGLSTISYDEFDNGNAFLFTLPITRKEYVFEKYVLSFILAVVSFAVMLVFTLFISRQKEIASTSDIVMMALIFLPLIFLLQAIMLPFHLKFGQERGRIAIILLVGAVLLLGSLLQNMGIEWMQLLPNLGQETLLLILYGASFVSLYLSLQISIRILLKKEF